MNKHPELDLLVDLAKLIKKHGPEPFEILANSISSNELTNQLAYLLSVSASTARKTPERKGRISKKKVTDSISSTLAILKQTEPRKYELISDFYNALQTKEVLPTLRDIKDFVMDCGLPEIRSNSRQKSISPLIKRLTLLPTEELSIKLKIPKLKQKGERSLEGWTRLILDKKS